MTAWPPVFDLQELDSFLERQTVLSDYPRAIEIQKRIPIYDADALQPCQECYDELFRVLAEGPGVLVVRAAQPDIAAIDRATDVFDAIIEREKRDGSPKGDHFAKAGANDRIWNSLEKHALYDPENFARYYASPAIDIVCTAWLGPAYQMTAQVNRVNPGGGAQSAHRDYHLGFMNDRQRRSYPKAMHLISPLLTLQGGVAHCDMPIESGPTMLLPYTQLWPSGYLYAHKVQAHFDQNAVQLPLNKGDALFFSPALLHAAGANTTKHVKRLTNLLQVSSAMGRSMEAVDRAAMVCVLEPVLKAMLESGDLGPACVNAVIAASAEGYAFPCNLDETPPSGGGAPASQADKLRERLGL